MGKLQIMHRVFHFGWAKLYHERVSKVFAMKYSSDSVILGGENEEAGIKTLIWAPPFFYKEAGIYIFANKSVLHLKWSFC